MKLKKRKEGIIKKLIEKICSKGFFKSSSLKASLGAIIVIVPGALIFLSCLGVLFLVKKFKEIL